MRCWLSGRDECYCLWLFHIEKSFVFELEFDGVVGTFSVEEILVGVVFRAGDGIGVVLLGLSKKHLNGVDGHLGVDFDCCAVGDHFVLLDVIGFLKGFREYIGQPNGKNQEEQQYCSYIYLYLFCCGHSFIFLDGFDGANGFDGEKYMFIRTLQLEDAIFGVLHARNLVSGFVVIDGLYDLVDDAMAHGEDCLVWIFVGHPL